MLESINRIYLITQKAEMMKTILAIYLVLVATATSVTASHVINESENPQFLFVMSAESGSYDGETLTLTGVPSVVYFSDRPYRIAGHMSVEEFVELWGEGVDNYEVDPPNATLSILEEDGAINIVVELSDLQNENDILTFKVRVLNGDAPASFGAASLFIDSHSLSRRWHI